MDEPARPAKDVRRRAYRWAIMALTLCCALLGAQHLPGTAARADVPEPFLTPAPVVVASDRLVCSLLGSTKLSIGIAGQDHGGGMTVVDGRAYWTFDDTRLADRTVMANMLAWSDDTDASDCITIVPQQAHGHPVTLLPRLPGEIGVWPFGMEETGPGEVHFFYTSVVEDATGLRRSAGVGIAVMHMDTLRATRALGGAFIWSDATGFPANIPRTYSDDEYVYIFLAAPADPVATGVTLARVPKGSMESPASYEYWQPAQGDDPGHWVAGLWDDAKAAWKPEIAQIRPLWTQYGGENGVDVRYNAFLGKWVAVYAGDYVTSIRVRTADELSGPWAASDALLIRCPNFHPVSRLFLCYSGTQLDYYARDGGRTIYVTYANSDAYQVFLHQVRLAAPVMQWTDEQGRAVYVAGKNVAPDGFKPDGLRFYASDIPVPGLSAIHQWQAADGTVRLGPSEPDPAAQDMGTAFYAPTSAQAAWASNAPYAPVFRWTKGGLDRYSPSDLSGAGYTRMELAFFAACPDVDRDGLDDCSESFPPCADVTGDRVVNIADLAFVVIHYRKHAPRGGVFTIRDVADVVRQFGQPCAD